MHTQPNEWRLKVNRGERGLYRPCQVSVRFTKEERAELNRLCGRLGCGYTDTIRRAVRLLSNVPEIPDSSETNTRPEDGAKREPK